MEEEFLLFLCSWGLGRPLEERVSQAKKLLAEAGYPDGFEVTQLTTSAQLETAHAVAADQWRKTLNIRVKLRVVPSAQLLDLIQRGDFGIYGRGNVTFNGAPEAFVGGNYVEGGSANWGHYTHPLVEELYVKMLREQDYSQVMSIFHQIERLLIQDVPAVPKYTYNYSIAHWPYVKPKMFIHPMYHSHYNGMWTVTWFDKNDPTWAKRAK